MPAGCRAVLSSTWTKCWFSFLIKAIHRVSVQIRTQGVEALRPSGLIERERNLDWGLIAVRRRWARWLGWARSWCCATVQHPCIASRSEESMLRF